jgi:predicted nuclease of predicted toxin-antitoxin system
MWDVSEWGEAKWGKEDGLFEAMLVSLNKRNGSKKNNGKDVLIAETAIGNGHVLVTDDCDLANVVREFDGKTISLQGLLSIGNAC